MSPWQGLASTTTGDHGPLAVLASAEVVVEAEISGMRVMPNPDMAAGDLPHTWVILRTLSSLKGQAAETIAIDVPGGWTENDHYVHVSGTPYMRTGDTILVALSVDENANRPGQTLFAAWGHGFARRVDVDGQAVGVSGEQQPLVAYGTAVDPAACEAADAPPARCGRPLMSWAALRESWEAATSDAASHRSWREGVHMAQSFTLEGL